MLLSILSSGPIGALLSGHILCLLPEGCTVLPLFHLSRLARPESRPVIIRYWQTWCSRRDSNSHRPITAHCLGGSADTGTGKAALPLITRPNRDLRLKGIQPHPVSITDIMRAGVQPGAGVGVYVTPCTLFCRDSRLNGLTTQRPMMTPLSVRARLGRSTPTVTRPHPRKTKLPRLESNQQPSDPESDATTRLCYWGLDPLRALAERVYSVVPLPSHRGAEQRQAPRQVCVPTSTYPRSDLNRRSSA